jgi:hypothetical protein
MGIIVMENGIPYIWHNTPKNHNTQGGSIMKHPLQEWEKTRTIATVTPSTLTREQIETRVAPLMERHFNWITFNCEHFVYQVWTGHPKSPQLTFWTFAILTVTTSAFLMIRNNRRHKNPA